MTKKKYQIRSYEFLDANIMPICDTCDQYIDEADVCDKCGKLLGKSFYCGDIVERDRANPEHLCSRCGDLLTTED